MQGNKERERGGGVGERQRETLTHRGDTDKHNKAKLIQKETINTEGKRKTFFCARPEMRSER